MLPAVAINIKENAFENLRKTIKYDLNYQV